MEPQEKENQKKSDQTIKAVAKEMIRWITHVVWWYISDVLSDP